MKKLLLATTNPGKLYDLKNFLSDIPLQLVSLNDIGIKEKVDETGKTFAENAVIKAEFYCRLSGLPTLADDGGFEIDAFGGEPGVKSHRWVDPSRESSDDELIEHTLSQMENIPVGKRGAQLRLVLALVLPNGKEYIVEEKIRGIVPPRVGFHRTKGYPYRSLLFLPELNKFYDHSQMTSDEIQQFDHRHRAVAKLKPLLKKFLI